MDTGRINDKEDLEDSIVCHNNCQILNSYEMYSYMWLFYTRFMKPYIIFAISLSY